MKFRITIIFHFFKITNSFQNNTKFKKKFEEKLTEHFIKEVQSRVRDY